MISAPLIEYLKKGIFTLLGAMLAVYLFVILLTYTGNDPSWSHISSDMTTISNTGGAMGAWLSDVLYSFFGFGAWWLIAFLVYESIWLWWGNKSTYWLIRVAAYIFLLLSGSALITQIMALFQLSPDWALIRPSGALGGIAGLELQLRLAAMLSPWGCALFLTLFMLITATFAFNIHWRQLYQKMTSAAWLGTGVKDPTAAKPAFAKANLDPQRQSQSKTSKPHQDKKRTKMLNDDHALSLEPAFEGAGSSSSIKHTLSDFLATSGLVASVKEAVAADSPKPPVEQSKATAKASVDKTNEASKNNDSKITIVNSADTGADSVIADTRVIDKNVIDKSNSKSPQLSPKEPLSSATPAASGAANFIQRAFAAKNSDPKPSPAKVEPSFAWNDSGMVEDLLAETAHFKAAETSEAAEANEPRPSSRFMYSIVDSETEAFSSTTNEPITADQESFNVDSMLPTTVSPALDDKEEDSQFDNSSQNALSTDLITEDLMQLAMGSYFMAPDDDNDQVEAETVAAEPAVSAFEPQDDDWQASEGLNDDTDNNDTSFDTDIYTDTDSDSFADIETLEVGLEALEASLDNSAAKVSKVAPTSAVTAAAPAELSKGLDDVDDEPSISFAIPDWQVNNTIPEMVADEPSLPDIHNDAAFATKSRAMQTASYRAQLTPVPALDILDKPDPNQEPSYSALELEQLSELLEIKLQEFNVKAEVVTAIPGPVVTRFEVELAAGVKASKVTGISRDLARSLSMASLRVVEVIPGKPYIGIEVPNKQREMVRLIELLHTKAYQDSNSHISMAMGKDISGKPIITDLTRAPHMLVAGTTGSGKSVLVNAMLLSMLLKYTPDELRLILIDPKQLELANYNDIPHLLTPVVTDMTEAASSLSWCVAEMERRYTLMSLLKVRKLNEFNKKVLAAEKLGQPLIDPLWRPNDSVSMDKAPKLKTLPLIVIVADEFADMIMQVGKQAEELITRLAQKSRAAGIHLMLATQRPSVDVITGLIKANIPVRAALRVNSKVDSRTILDSGGAEDMLGNGDMLFLGPGQIEPERVHGAYVSDEEVNRVCDAWRDRGAPDYIDDMSGNFELTAPSGGASGASGEDDDLYNDAVAFVMETRKVSASSIQRKFSIGYNRAARIVDSMEDAGLVSSMGKSGKRELLM